MAGGKLGYEERVDWWKDYQDQAYCIFGHYGKVKGDEPLKGRAICVDFGVAKRWEERKEPGFNGSFKFRLGAVRFPEAELVFDNGVFERLAP